MKRNIAFISENASPLNTTEGAEISGQNVYVAELAKALVALDYQIDIYTRRDNPELPDVMNLTPGIRLIHITVAPEHLQGSTQTSYMQAFMDEMLVFIHQQRLNYAVIHAHHYTSAWIAMRIKPILNIPFTVTFHTLALVRQQHEVAADDSLEESILIEREIIQNADAIVAECPQDRVDLMQLYNANPATISMIPCGFSTAEFSPVDKDEARAYLGLPVHERIVLQVGRMVPRKGVDNVIRAVALAQQQVADLRLVIVGGPTDQPDPKISPEIDRLQQLAHHLGVSRRVSFAGRKDRDLLRYFYSAADICVSTPWYEPFGITPVEAMACARPVIGSEVGGIKYSVVDSTTGYLVQPEDPQTLADRMARLLNDEDHRQRMGSAALTRVNMYFTWQKVAFQMDALYRRMIKQVGGMSWMQFSVK